MESVLGIGNAIVDIPVLLPDNTILDEFAFPEGSMNHIDAPVAARLQERTKGLEFRHIQGGSAANTVAGASQLGLRCGFIGKIGGDALGSHFLKGLVEEGVQASMLEGKLPSGRAYTFIRKTAGCTIGGDESGQVRTFAAYLGAALEFSPKELSEQMFEGYDCLHVEGYLMQCSGVVQRAMEIARGRGMKISFDLGSAGIVQRFRGIIGNLIEEYADIVFANLEEAEAFAGCSAEEAAGVFARLMRCGNGGIAVVKLGAEGSIVQCGGQLCQIAPVQAKAADTTGAGDAYAAGFLYAHSKGADAGRCGKAGSLLASKVVEAVGPKISKSGWKVAKTEIDALLK